MSLRRQRRVDIRCRRAALSLTTASPGTATPPPQVRRWTVVPGRDRFLVLATDGIWDVLSNGDVAAIVLAVSAASAAAAVSTTAPTAGRGGGSSRAAQAAANALVRYALQRGSADNVTALVVDLATKAAASAAVTAPPPLSRETPVHTPGPADTAAAQALPSAASLPSVVAGDASTAAGDESSAVLPTTPVVSDAVTTSAAVGRAPASAVALDAPASAAAAAALIGERQDDVSDAATVVGTFSPHLRRQGAGSGSEGGGAALHSPDDSSGDVTAVLEFEDAREVEDAGHAGDDGGPAGTVAAPASSLRRRQVASGGVGSSASTSAAPPLDTAEQDLP